MFPRGVPGEGPDYRVPLEAWVWGQIRGSNFEFVVDLVGDKYPQLRIDIVIRTVFYLKTFRVALDRPWAAPGSPERPYAESQDSYIDENMYLDVARVIGCVGSHRTSTPHGHNTNWHGRRLESIRVWEGTGLRGKVGCKQLATGGREFPLQETSEWSLESGGVMFV